VDYPPGRQAEAGGRLGLTRLATAELSAGGMQLCRTCFAVNGPVHSTTTSELPVGGVNDGVHLLGGDVA
jgi:hypothetical protein